MRYIHSGDQVEEDSKKGQSARQKPPQDEQTAENGPQARGSGGQKQEVEASAEFRPAWMRRRPPAEGKRRKPVATGNRKKPLKTTAETALPRGQAETTAGTAHPGWMTAGSRPAAGRRVHQMHHRNRARRRQRRMM